MSANVILKKGEGRTLKAGGAWIYDNEIDKIEGDFENGDMVFVSDFDGYPMGQGFINTRSKITVRMMTRKKDTVVDDAFIEMRVRDAWEYRKTTVDTSSCRLIFGEADFLPGIVIDKFADVLVVESLALGIDRFKPVILDKLKKVLAEDGISIRGVYERSDAKVRLQEGMERVTPENLPRAQELLHEVGRKFRCVVTVEDGALRGGVGEAVVAFFCEHGYLPKVVSLGIPDRFVEHGTPAQLYAQCGYDAEGIYRTLKSLQESLQ